MNDGLIPPRQLVVLNPIVRLSNALLRGSLGPNTQRPSPFRWKTITFSRSKNKIVIGPVNINMD